MNCSPLSICNEARGASDRVIDAAARADIWFRKMGALQSFRLTATGHGNWCCELLGGNPGTG